jgi:hypothetical protein
MTDHIYDIETYPNFFCHGTINTLTHELLMFECSDRVNHSNALRGHLSSLSHQRDRMVGFNNEGFDYPVLHHCLLYDTITAEIAYSKAQVIIDTPWDARFINMVWDSDKLVQQVDLFKIHHFDNASRATSLKMLEFNMKSDTIEELPYPPGTVLTPEQMDVVIQYNIKDLMETWRFYLVSLERIKFRDELTEMYGRDHTNFNDPKIGKQYFISQLNAAGVTTKGPVGDPLQTLRPRMDLKDAILPTIRFDQPEFNRILNWFKAQTITTTKGVFEDVNCTVGGFKFDFGLGGIHGSVESQKISSDSEYTIIDLDVTSYYPRLAIVNRFHPEHLGDKFCDIYQDIFEQRSGYAKGTAKNAMLKLALNGSYGDTNNKFSPFYDPLCTMKITINGQLQLCMLAEALMSHHSVEMIQANTDGMTIRVPRLQVGEINESCRQWEQETGLNLESNEYSRMFIRDVNSYIAEYTDGKVKRKGAYGYGPDLDWNQNHGQQVVAKAAEAHLLHGTSVREFIETHGDMHDFFSCTKVPRSSHLILVDQHGNESMLNNVTRYYVSNDGGSLIKCMPPLAKKPGEWRRIGIKVGHLVHPCNNIKDAIARINYEYYIIEANKLCLT